MTKIELHWTEIDHVPVVWTDAPAPFRAGLFFRSGRIDETLVTAGQTHLLEHLALSAVNDMAQNHNGFVGAAVTGFLAVGSPQEVSSFLARLCDQLTALPGERIEGEKQVLAAENAARPYDFCANLLTCRYGARGYGLLGIPEFGLPKATLEQLHALAAQRFTSGNAVLWLSGPPPADLCLRLPAGIRQPLHPLVPLQRTFPAWIMDNHCGGVAVGATVSRVSAASIFNVLASLRLRKELRSVQAVSYAPAVFYDHLTPDTAHLVLYADSHQDHRAELSNVFAQVFAGLGEIDEAEIETARKQISDHWSGTLAPQPTEIGLVEVQRAAMDWILGKEFESLELNEAQLSSVSVEEVAAFVHEIQATALFALPGQAKLQPCFGKQLPPSTLPVVQGREARRIDAPIQQERLLYGPEGVSVVLPKGTHYTVRYADLAGALHYEDGCVQLISSDATSIVVEPTLWHGGQNACRQIYAQIPPHLRLDHPARPTNAIPKPTTTAWQRLRARFSQH